MAGKGIKKYTVIKSCKFVCIGGCECLNVDVLILYDDQLNQSMLPFLFNSGVLPYFVIFNVLEVCTERHISLYLYLVFVSVGKVAVKIFYILCCIVCFFLICFDFMRVSVIKILAGGVQNHKWHPLF